MKILNVNPDKLFFVEETEEIWSKLKSIPRTGWLQWKVPNPETVYEHVMSVIRLAVEWRDDMSLTEDEYIELLKMIEVHDWPEVITGDQVILGDEPDATEQMKNKKITEAEAMKKLCRALSHGGEISALYDRYENSDDIVAQHCRQIEKFQAILLAFDYEHRYNKKGLTYEFLKYSSPKIKIPFLVARMEQVAKKVDFAL
ncbi:HD domain-containing protein [Candidatus Kaiserbacteria bacterium]|nr:HD domain-containing protein [Candidatus Kaiserbacteria bacterium]USN92437.1 MAG: HD domain-containing protein [Candidatus Nomurabacteria bacterium]